MDSSSDGGASSSFTVSFTDDITGRSSNRSLQESFSEYRKRRQAEIRENRSLRNRERDEKAEPSRMMELRRKFLDQAKSYIGVPYARKYWTPDEPEYLSPMFLDCCGLVRRVLTDLKEDFGFCIGSWNQAYQCDTLPITVDDTSNLLPGDLVFISATYYNPKSKKQKHDIVHVEIWLGEGEKTLGARWQRGKVQVHDSYMFEAKSYHSPTYIFKSIDTWLSGVCQSFCNEHNWKTKRYNPDRLSIFYVDGQQQSAFCQQTDQSAGDTDNELMHFSPPVPFDLPLSCDTDLPDDCLTDNRLDRPRSADTGTEMETGRLIKSLSDTDLTASFRLPTQANITDTTTTDISELSRPVSCSPCLPSRCLRKLHLHESSISSSTSQSFSKTRGHPTTTCHSATTGKSGSPVTAKSASSERRTRRDAQRLSLNLLSQPVMSSYQICGGNGGHIIDSYLSSLGWKKIPDKNNFNWKLKWVEVNAQVNFDAFKDGEQLVNRIPNCSLLTNKLGLFNSLSEYSRVNAVLKGDRVRTKLTDFLPETYRLDHTKDKEIFMDVYKDGQIWICKPVGMNQGKGIFLVRSQEQLERMFLEREERKQTRRTKPLMALIIQKYIERPLLLDKRKFDIRAYMVIPSTMPFLVLYRRGYVRLTCSQYDLDSLDLTSHLTNQYVQKRHEDFKDIKEETVWSMDKMNQYVNENYQEAKGLEQDWVFNVCEKMIKTIMKYCFNSVRHKLISRLGYFDIYGLDFMVDENMKIYLIEVNCNPSMSISRDVLKEIIPETLHETIDLALECFDKSKKGQPLMPLQNLRTFQILYNGCPRQGQGHHSPGNSGTSISTSTNGTPVVQTSNQSPTRASQSQSPNRANQTRRSASPSKQDQGWGYMTRSPIKSQKTTESDQNKLPSSNNRNSGVNYIKNNIASLGNQAPKPRNPNLPSTGVPCKAGRISRLDTKTSDVTYPHLTETSSKLIQSGDSNQDASSNLVAKPESAKSNAADETPIPEESAMQDSEGTNPIAPYNKPAVNSAPVTQQHIAARARRTNTTASSITPAVTMPDTTGSWKAPEQILQELKEHRPKPPHLPPLYTIRSDVVTSHVVPASHPSPPVPGVQPMMHLQGYPAISNGGGALSSPVRLSLVHAAYSPTKFRTRVNSYNNSVKRLQS